jgi:hypothetical protein
MLVEDFLNSRLEEQGNFKPILVCATSRSAMNASTVQLQLSTLRGRNIW